MFTLFNHITVCSREKILSVPEIVDGADAIISIGDKNPPGWIKHPHVLYLEFNDMPTLGEYPNQGPNVTPDHIRQATDFAKRYASTGKLVIHCGAGISRSPAIAIACAVALGYSLPGIGNEVPWGRVQVNPVIVRYTDEFFKLNGELIELVSEKQRDAGRPWRGDREPAKDKEKS